jgi:hypothetical protein
VPELVFQDSAHGGAERAVPVTAPDAQVLAHAVDLDRLQHDVDCSPAEEAAHGDESRELPPARQVERREVLQAEELLPERDVPHLDDDHLVENAA